MGDFSFLLNSSILNSVIFDQPIRAGKQETHTLDPLLESMVNSSCNYHTTIDYCDKIIPSLSLNSSFNVFCLNVRGIRDKWDSLKSYLWSDNSCPFDVIGLTETWLSDGENFTAYDMHGYVAVHIPRMVTKCSGGISLFIKSDIEFRRRSDLESLFTSVVSNSRTVYSLVIDLKSQFACDTVCLFYKPPPFPTHLFCDLLDQLSCVGSFSKKRICVLGDFNCNMLNIGSSDECDHLFDVLSSAGLLPSIFFPSRVDPTRNSATLIDNIFISHSSNLKFTSGLVFTDLSDHFPIYVSLFVPQTEIVVDEQGEFSFRTSTDKEISNLIHSLQSNDWSSVLEANDVDCATSLFLCRMGALLDKHFPLRKRPRNSIPKCPWMSRGLINATHMKASLFKAACKSKTQDDLLKYKLYKNVLTSSVRAAKKLYFSRRIDECKGNLRKVWTVVNEALSRKKLKQSPPCRYRKADGSFVDKNSSASAFNSYFTSLPSVPNPPYSRVSSFPLAEKSFFLFPCSDTEISNIISQLSSSRTVDGFGLSCNVLKKIGQFVSNPISHITNLSLSSGVFPHLFKVANVVPLFKKGDSSLISNYRPISLLPVISKVVEKVVYCRLSSFVFSTNTTAGNSLITNHQYGFRPSFSTLHALSDATEFVRVNLDKGLCVLGLFLDFSKAFDMVVHSVLLSKLSSFGVHGVPLEWFRSYLSGRSQYVSVNGTSSSSLPIVKGVPQGSVLGPLLFLIYINDLVDGLHPLVHPILFADDSNFFIAAVDLPSAISLAQGLLDKVKDWCWSNGMTLNSQKSAIVHFRTPYRMRDAREPTILTYGNDIIPQATIVKFLGVYLDCFLSFKPHITHTRSLVLRQSSMLYRVNSFLPPDVMLSLYYAFIFPYLSYCCSVWGSTNKSLLCSLQRAQNRAVKATFLLPRFYPSSDLYNDTGIAPLDRIVGKSYLYLAHSAFLGRLPPSLQQFFFLSGSGRYSSFLRSSYRRFILPKRSSTAGQRSPVYQSILLWNSIPPDVPLSLSAKALSRWVFPV